MPSYNSQFTYNLQADYNEGTVNESNVLIPFEEPQGIKVTETSGVGSQNPWVLKVLGDGN